MRRLFTLRTEIALRIDNASAEVPLPHAVYRHARGQGVALVNEPASEIQPVRSSRAGGKRLENGKHSWLDLSAFTCEISTQVDIANARLREFPHDHGAQQLGSRLTESGRVLPQLLQHRVRFAIPGNHVFAFPDLVLGRVHLLFPLRENG